MNASAVIVDDEDLPRAELRRMLAQVWPQLEILAECEDGLTAHAALAELKPDIAFLDIRMPGLSGLRVATQAPRGCQIVFTTAYDNHAIQAFESGAVDYLLKPVTAERLVQTVSRLQERLLSHRPTENLTELLRQLEHQSPAGSSLPKPASRLRWVSASAGDIIKLISIDDVLFFESDQKYTRVVTASDEAHVRAPLKELACGLDPEQFWQISRGVIVRAASVAQARRNELGRITVHLRGRHEAFAVSNSNTWRFRPM